MAICEFGGYALHSSYAYPDNMLDKIFSPQNFSLGMALFFALYFPLGNWAVAKIHAALFKKTESATDASEIANLPLHQSSGSVLNVH